MTNYNIETLDSEELRKRFLEYFNGQCYNALNEVLEPEDCDKLDYNFLETLALDDSKKEPIDMWRTIIEKVGQPQYAGPGLRIIRESYDSPMAGTHGAEFEDCSDIISANEITLQKPWRSKSMGEIIAEAEEIQKKSKPMSEIKADAEATQTGLDKGKSAGDGHSSSRPSARNSGGSGNGHRRGSNFRAI